MNKREFLLELRKEVNGLPRIDIEKSIEYYSEIIDDIIVDSGMTEEEAVDSLESPKEIAKQMLMDISLSTLVKDRVKPKRTLKAWEIVLIILGSPVWLPIFICVVIVLLSIYFSLWIMILSLYVIDLSVVFAALTSIVFGGINIGSGNIVNGIFYLGTGLALIGASILMFFGFFVISKYIVKLSKQFVLWIKNRFVKRGDTK